MRRDNIFRLIALIILCALVYYFSFDQGREAMKPKLARLERALIQKERTIEDLSLEIRRLKEKLEQGNPSDIEQEPAIAPTREGGLKINVRLRASRILYDARLVITCLAADPSQRMTTLQINLVQEGRILTQSIGLGQAIKFRLNGQELTLIVEKIHSSYVSLQIVV